MFGPALIVALAGCGGSSFQFEPGFSPDAPAAVADYLEPLDLEFKDAFFVGAELEGQPMVGVLASTFPDACEAYTGFVPVASDAYQTMLAADGGDVEDEALSGWQEAMLQTFPVGGAVLFVAFGVDELAPSAVEGGYTQELELASSTLDDTQGPQPAGTFVADLVVLAEGLDIFCIYTGQCDLDEMDAAWHAYHNLWGADQGALTIDRFETGRKVEGSVDMSLVNRWLDTEFGTAAPLGDASASFKVKACDGVDERLFRFWAFL